MNQMGYTFAVFYKGSDAKHRAKSVVHFTGVSLKDIMEQAKAFKEKHPEYTMGAGIPGIHNSVP